MKFHTLLLKILWGKEQKIRSQSCRFCACVCARRWACRTSLDLPKNPPRQSLSLASYRGFTNWPLYTVGKDRTKKEAATPDWQVAGLVNKGTYIYGFSWMVSRSPHPPARILTVYIQVLTGFSHVNHPDGFHTFSLKATSLKTAPTAGTWAERTFQGRGGARSLRLHRSCSQSCPFNDLLQQGGELRH